MQGSVYLGNQCPSVSSIKNWSLFMIMSLNIQSKLKNFCGLSRYSTHLIFECHFSIFYADPLFKCYLIFQSELVGWVLIWPHEFVNTQGMGGTERRFQKTASCLCEFFATATYSTNSVTKEFINALSQVWLVVELAGETIEGR